MNVCSRCKENFRSLTAFDAHPCIRNPQDLPVMRRMRRISLVTIGPDTVRLCDPECRNEVLLDLGVPGRPPSGSAVVPRPWRTDLLAVSWERRRPSSHPCDLCGEEWRYRPPVVRAQREPTERQKAAREAFGARFGGKD